MAQASLSCDRDVYLPQPATVISKTVLTPAEMLLEMRLGQRPGLGPHARTVR